MLSTCMALVCIQSCVDTIIIIKKINAKCVLRLAALRVS